ncbi:hypothetical protein Acr_09g0001100 [Actinidia rufa]|uniref:Uncharacterized protein n=1 Tax=Actinidia rufa TaxID=165716 RepID=A0A7J0F4Q1_9ERIC|nr:hypothetical protein Acr_09g0001100 [Actinidia rufa]
MHIELKFLGLALELSAMEALRPFSYSFVSHISLWFLSNKNQGGAGIVMDNGGGARVVKKDGGWAVAGGGGWGKAWKWWSHGGGHGADIVGSWVRRK